MEDGFYLIKDGVTYKVDLPMNIPLSKTIDLRTGEIHYPTNRMRLRAMSDDELAEWLDYRLSECPWCNPAAPVKPGSNECELFDCQQCCLDWLRQEASE